MRFPERASRASCFIQAIVRIISTERVYRSCRSFIS
jgi:hypothetical protein